ncbi:MAG: hypothetical protein KBT28_12395 [Bacteroidales bacterium]|nr:hypothetical protein [Candidatus Colimorpha merdihippi]
MRWRNVKTGALVDGPDWLAMPQGIYEPICESEDGFDQAPVEDEISCNEEAPHDGEPLCDDEQDGEDGEISSTEW